MTSSSGDNTLIWYQPPPPINLSSNNAVTRMQCTHWILVGFLHLALFDGHGFFLVSQSYRWMPTLSSRCRGSRPHPRDFVKVWRKEPSSPLLLLVALRPKSSFLLFLFLSLHLPTPAPAKVGCCSDEGTRSLARSLAEYVLSESKQALPPLSILPSRSECQWAL